MTAELKPGQKFPTPTPGFGDRVFYETLLKQRPESAMAQEWCVAYGVLPYAQAEELHKVVLERKRTLKLGGSLAVSPTRPTKSATSNNNNDSNNKKKKKKKPSLIDDDGMDDDPDMTTSGGDGIGRAVL